ncbi:MAG: NrdJb [Lysobacterales bacterium CG17_big_fil_post_rev_8_21_14_2_50_64_11]|nr:MAG: NrdJb [Xanthomonadales bacterium CG17_big_fil_post_rev_8_21_14_2_50_64_11]PIX60579.1 MAG: NrdJb [Xanthomonadales bacterium CG_4_10_14_3_um_filter_64_11]
MTVKINKKIKSYSIAKPAQDVPATAHADVAEPSAFASAEVIQMHERLERPQVLVGSTYKIKSPLVEHAMYVTINDIVLNPGTEHELRRPFEVFINSKNMDHFQWIVALTRIMSAVFRKGGDVTFLVDEMKAVFDPRGGYFKAGGLYMPSIVAEIGAVVEEHLKSIGLIVDDELSDGQKRLIADKRAAYESRSKKKRAEPAAAATAKSAGDDVSVTGDGTSFPPSASMCLKCNTKATIIMDGCATCLNCGYSKCG